jgi:Flp pilus assembly protein TadB
MTRLAVLSGLVLWAGATLVLSELRWFARPSLADRLRPYAPARLARAPSRGVFSVESFRDVIGPLARSVGERLAHLFGVNEELALRLERVHSELDVTRFRTRQLGWAAVAFGVTVLGSVALGAPAPLTVVLVIAGPLLAFLITEQQLLAVSHRRQQQVFLELPVVSEQLAMLLSAGYSLGAALNRLAVRGSAGSACAQDLRRVSGRIRQGLTEVEALREWASIARVEALDRLVPILALNRETGDLGRLLSAEARNIRRDVHRQLVEVMERRGQQVWIPVTVATLVPGVVFMAIPFIEALRVFSGS